MFAACVKGKYSHGICNLQSSFSSIRRFNNGNNVNADEIEKFSVVGSDWWKRNSKFGTGPLHAMNSCRVTFIRECIATKMTTQHLLTTDQIKGISILDVGCGGGLLSEALARLGANVVSIDPAEKSISIAQLHSSIDPLTSTIEYRNCTIEDIVESGQKFDVVCSLEVLEHVDMPMHFISQCVKCLNDDGSLFLSTLNKTLKSYAVAIVGAEYITGIIPPGTHDFKKFISPHELSVMVKSSSQQMEVDKINGMVFNISPSALPVCGQWELSNSDTDINYILHAIKRRPRNNEQI